MDDYLQGFTGPVVRTNLINESVLNSVNEAISTSTLNAMASYNSGLRKGFALGIVTGAIGLAVARSYYKASKAQAEKNANGGKWWANQPSDTSR